MEGSEMVVAGLLGILAGFILGLWSANSQTVNVRNEVHLHPEPWEDGDDEEDEADEELRRQRRILRDPENGWRE